MLTNTRPLTSARSTRALAAVDERVEGADDVVAVDAEVEREVVARAGGDAGVRQAALGGDRGDDRLRAVAAGHRERVGAAIDRVADERLEVVARLQLDRLDPARARLVGEREALRLAAARARVEEQHRSARRRRPADRRGRRACARAAARATRSPATTSSSASSDSPATSTATAPASARPATVSPATRAGPRRSTPYQAAAAGDQHAAEQAQAARELAHRDRDGEGDRGRSHHQRDDRRQPPTHRTATTTIGSLLRSTDSSIPPSFAAAAGCGRWRFLRQRPCCSGHKKLSSPQRHEIGAAGEIARPWVAAGARPGSGGAAGTLAGSGTARRRASGQNHAIGTMRVAPVLPTFACMFRRTPKSSPVVESSSTADVRHEADLRVGHLDDWRDAAKREGRAYVAWCAAGRGDRHHLYAAFLDALQA